MKKFKLGNRGIAIESAVFFMVVLVSFSFLVMSIVLTNGFRIKANDKILESTLSLDQAAEYLVNNGFGVADPYMCLADFDSYLQAYKNAVNDYSDKLAWAEKSLLNTASSGVFASDNSISKYANEIWNISPVNKIK